MELGAALKKGDAFYTAGENILYKHIIREMDNTGICDIESIEEITNHRFPIRHGYRIKPYGLYCTSRLEMIIIERIV